MRSGSLREVVTLYDLVRGRDAIGGYVTSWGNARECYAAVDTMSAREFLAAQGTAEAQIKKFIMRYDPTLSMTSKIVWEGSDYNIMQIRNVESRDRMLEVVAVKRSPA